MSKSDQRSFAHKIGLIARQLRRRFDKRARLLSMPGGEPLTRAQWRTLAVIQQNPGATQSEIAALLEVSTVTCGRVIDRLESAGWAERRPDAQDRRANRLYLRAAADPVLERMGLLGTSEDQRAMTGLTVEEATLLGTLLEKVIRNLSDAAPQDDGLSRE